MIYAIKAERQSNNRHAILIEKCSAI